MVRRQGFEKIGGFDPFYFYYIEDCDLSWRIKKSGLLIGISPKIKFWHQYIPRRRSLNHSDLAREIYFILKNYSLSRYLAYLFYFSRENLTAFLVSRKSSKAILLFFWYLLA